MKTMLNLLAFVLLLGAAAPLAGGDKATGGAPATVLAAAGDDITCKLGCWG